MSLFQLRTSELFAYNPAHRVLICKKCHYAVQKSAVQSHLLRHKIYRYDKQRIALEIKSLGLLEPEEVPIPAPSSPPIAGLPVLAGYRCTVAGCNSLCVSIKRMKRHYADAHKADESATSAPSWEAAQLQTFFRGTKLKYFEVTVSPNAFVGAVIPESALAGGSRDAMREVLGDVASEDPVMEADIMRWQPSSQQPEKPIVQVPTSPNVDLETLFYFNRYITVTCISLPEGKDKKGYWRTNVVQMAFQRQWLMCGLLTVSALEMASGVWEDKPFLEICTKQVYNYGHGFFAARTDEGYAPNEPEVEEAAVKIASLIRCLHWSLNGLTVMDIELPTLSWSIDICALVDDVRVLALGKGTIGREEQDAKQAEFFKKGKTILNSLPKSLPEYPPNLESLESTRLAFLNRLRLLTFRLSETLGRPADANDVVATLSAIAILVVCGDMSCRSDNPLDTWEAMALWTTTIPDYFRSMIRQNNPAALVVLSHWSWLMWRAEQSGCWYMTNMGACLYHEIGNKLDKESYEIQRLSNAILDFIEC